jgi:glutathione synthase/RimK-type ligase-like ATP-grasp enzyme
MSLYGLDIIVDREGRRRLIEINGVNSGTNGFKEVYGDDRVRNKIIRSLENCFGTITMGNLEAARELCLIKTGKPLIEKVDVIDGGSYEWLEEEGPNEKKVEYPFETHNGQLSFVFNSANVPYDWPTINDHVVEVIVRNKFLQFLLLRQTEFAEDLPMTALVGMGAGFPDEISALLNSGDETYVIKPVLGYCGRAVNEISREEVSRLIDGSGYVSKQNVLTEILEELGIHISKGLTLRELLSSKKMTHCEAGLRIVQEKIDAQEDDGKFHVVRAIVCLDEFIDAYKRIGSDFRVNLSQGAKAEVFEYDEDFERYCVKVVQSFENACLNAPFGMSGNGYLVASNLYKQYFDQKAKMRRPGTRLLNMFHELVTR